MLTHLPRGNPIFSPMIRNAGYPNNNPFSFRSLNPSSENAPF
jgi:hypothetical protein